MNKIVYFVILIIHIIKFLCVESHDFVFIYERILDVNDSCIIEQTGQPGTCGYFQDCPELHVDRFNRPQYCGFYNDHPIVCCPNKSDVKVIDNISDGNGDFESNFLVSRINDFVTFNQTCRVARTGEYGSMSRVKYCTYAVELLENGIQLPPACPYEVCNDLVCCPHRECSVNNNRCHQADIYSLIRKRFTGSFNCKVAETNADGVYTEWDSCSYYEDNIKNNIPLPKVCEWDMCTDYVCCPKTHLNCRSSEDIVFEEIELSAGPCTDAGGQTGVCKSIDQCPYLKNSDIIPTPCGLECHVNLVCCPEPDINKLTTSQRACLQYRSEAFEDNRIITSFLPPEIDRTRIREDMMPASGGILASYNDFPHMTVLGFDDGANGIEWSCGGSLISDEFVLTAAHCLASRTGPVRYIRIGINDLNYTQFSCNCPKMFEVREIVPHPDYNYLSKYNDIGLIRLNRKAILYSDIRPICLPDNDDIPLELDAAGFGETEFGGKKSDRLVKVKLDYFSYEDCSENFKFNFNQRFQGIDMNSQFCAGSRGTIMDTCRGDSGGPIQANHTEYYRVATLYGITSFGKACGFAGTPAIYTKVYPYIPWIESIVWAK